MQNFYLNYKGQIDNLRKEIKNKDKIISKLSATLHNITINFFLKDPMVALNNHDSVSETAPSNSDENILPFAGNCFMQQIVKGECARIPASSTKTNKEIADYRQQKRQQFDIFQKTARSEVSDENCTINYLSLKEIKHT